MNEGINERTNEMNDELTSVRVVWLQDPPLIIMLGGRLLVCVGVYLCLRLYLRLRLCL